MRARPHHRTVVRTMRIKIIERSVRSYPLCSATTSTSPTRSRSGTVTSPAHRCTFRCLRTVARRKIELLHKCFPSQRSRQWWDNEVFFGLARLRGMECRARYAEAFTCTKSLICVQFPQPDTAWEMTEPA